MPTIPDVPPELERRVNNDEKALEYYKNLVKEMRFTEERPVSHMVLVSCALAYANYWHDPDSIEAEKRWQGWELYIALQKANEHLDSIQAQTWTMP